MDRVLKNISGSGRISGTRWTLSLILDPDAYIYVGGVPWALFLVINADEKIKRICDKKENDDIATMSVVKLI